MLLNNLHKKRNNKIFKPNNNNKRVKVKKNQLNHPNKNSFNIYNFLENQPKKSNHSSENNKFFLSNNSNISLQVFDLTKLMEQCYKNRFTKYLKLSQEIVLKLLENQFDQSNHCNQTNDLTMEIFISLISAFIKEKQLSNALNGKNYCPSNHNGKNHSNGVEQQKPKKNQVTIYLVGQEPCLNDLNNYLNYKTCTNPELTNSCYHGQFIPVEKFSHLIYSGTFRNHERFVNLYFDENYLYESYLAFSQVLNTYLYALIQKKKNYSDEKSFYRDFNPHLKVFYSFNQKRRNDGYYFFNLKHFAQETIKINQEILLNSFSQSKNSNYSNFKTYQHFLIMFFANSSLKNVFEKFGQKIINFWVMKIFINIHLKTTGLVFSQNLKAQDFYNSYCVFSKSLDNCLLSWQQELTFYGNNKPIFLKEFENRFRLETVF